MISTKTHGMLDYVTGILLIASPWIFNFTDDGYAQHIPVLLGIVTLLMAIGTNYELGIIRVIHIKTHLIIDFILGLLLAVSPWLFDFYTYTYIPHLIIGVFEMGAALFTRSRPVFNNNNKLTVERA